MAEALPPDAPPSATPPPLVQAILEGSAARAVRLAAARGALPLARADIFRLIVALCADSDEQVKEEAGRSLEAWPRDELQALAGDPSADPALLAFFLGWTVAGPDLLAAALSNPSTPPEALLAAAASFPPESLDTLLINQTLLIKDPRLLDAIEANPNATPLHRNRVEEFRRHFFAPAREAAPPKAPAAPPAEAAPPPVPQAPLPPRPAPAAVGEISAEAEKAAGEGGAYQRIMNMSVGEKMQLAFKGTREERSILIRDTNRVVQEAVLGSPKITDGEVEVIARMRNVSEDILRQIAGNRDWMKSYAIMQGLVTNPKTPLGISLNLLSRLNTQDVKLMVGDKNVPEALRRQARKTLDARINKPGGGARGGH